VTRDVDSDRDDASEAAPDPIDDGIAVSAPPPPAPDPGPGGDAGDEAHLIDALAQRDEYLGQLQRLQADFENYRKRVSRQQADVSARAAAELVAKLLPVLDTFDLAVAHLSGEPAEGEAPGAEEAGALDQARSQLMDALEREGLERVGEVGVPFDPVVHDAVAHAESDGTDPGPTVDEVLRAGYRWRGQVLRPAMVRVRG
jgi:molecular chaperone GrpE